MNNDLISRSALKEHIGSYAGMFTDELGFAVSMEAVLRGIDFAESVDAVEVCRCKDCEKRKTKRCAMVQTCINCGWDAWTETDDDDFCSYGERKEDG